MATRGTEFIGTELLKQVAGNYDRAIAPHEEALNRLHALTMEERHRAWRASAEAQLVDLYRRLDEATDSELHDFRIGSPPAPSDNRWKIQSHEEQIERLQQAKEKALAYVSSLAADQGVVTLSAADLRRIGYQP